MTFSQFFAPLTRRFTAFRVTEAEYEFVDEVAKEKGYGRGPAKGHAMVLREALVALKEKREKEAKRIASKEKLS